MDIVVVIFVDKNVKKLNIRFFLNTIIYQKELTFKVLVVFVVIVIVDVIVIMVIVLNVVIVVDVDIVVVVV